jgi:hypothetical protein
MVRRANVGEAADCPRWPEEFWEGALQRGTGGTCVECNYAFLAFLKHLPTIGAQIFLSKAISATQRMSSPQSLG